MVKLFSSEFLRFLNEMNIIIHKYLGFLALLIFTQVQGKDFSRNLDTNTQEQINEVWVLGDGEKVFKKELNHPSKKKENNLIWDGQTIRLKGFYNEILAFQVIVESGKRGAKAVEIKVTNPTNEQGQSIGNSPQIYGDNGTVEIFTQHYLNVSPVNVWMWTDRSKPKQMSGWIPDALIPANRAKKGRGGFPVKVEPSANQGFWIDLHLPKNNNYASGLYKSSVQVLNNGVLIKEIPLEVTLLPATLPEENKTNVWVFTNNPRGYYDKYISPENVEKMFKFEGRRHRIEIFGSFEAGKIRSFNENVMNRYKKWLDGTGYSQKNGYYGPGQNVGDKYFSIYTYGGRDNALAINQKSAQIDSDNWVKWFDRHSPNTKYFWYVIDEPREEEQFAWVKERIKWIKQNPGKGRRLPVFSTVENAPGRAERLISMKMDYLAGTSSTIKAEYIDAAKNNNGDFIFYNGARPYNGIVVLEGAAVDFRVNSWIMYKYGVSTHFIWQSTQWGSSERNASLYTTPRTYKIGNKFINGDGVLFYSGVEPNHALQDRGIIDALVPSIRLKNIRRGQQDALIFQKAEKKLSRDGVINRINKIVPRALWETDDKNSERWSENGDDYDRVIDELRNIIVQ